MKILVIDNYDSFTYNLVQLLGRFNVNIIIKKLGDKIPILGVCLGHQAIGYVFGGRIINAPLPVHGKISKIKHDSKTIFRNIEQNFTATRYHSLIIERKTFPADLEISAETQEGTIMGIRHRKFPVEGIQFHPESILTERGKGIIKNWI